GQRGLDCRRRLIEVDARGKLGRDHGAVGFELSDVGVALDIADQLLKIRTVGRPDSLAARSEAARSADEKRFVVMFVERSDDRQAVTPRDRLDAICRRVQNEFVPLREDRFLDSANGADKAFPLLPTATALLWRG